MKKLMFTLIVVALSGSSLFGVHELARGPIIQTPAEQKLVMNQTLYDCMEGKGTSSIDMTTPEAQQTYEECYEELYGEGIGEVSIGDGKDGLYW